MSSLARLISICDLTGSGWSAWPEMVDSCLNIQLTWSIVFCWLNGLWWSTISDCCASWSSCHRWGYVHSHSASAATPSMNTKSWLHFLNNASNSGRDVRASGVFSNSVSARHVWDRSDRFDIWFRAVRQSVWCHPQRWPWSLWCASSHVRHKQL